MISRFFRSLSPGERRAAVTILCVHLLLIGLPYLWALAVTPHGFVYGGLLYNPDDQNVHLAWARQAAEGHFTFRDLFTNESLLSGERPLFTNLLCWLIGVTGALTTLPLIWLYHLARVAFAALALLLFYALAMRLTGDRRVRLTALALAAFAGGGGFLAALLPGINWMDRPDNASFPMMPEAFTFASSFIFTLNIASMALLLAVFLLALRTWETGSRKTAIGAGAAALLLSNFHTYDVFPLLAALAAWAIVLWRTPSNPDAPRGRYAFLPAVAVGAAIPVLYQLVVFRGSEEFRVKALTKTLAPPLWDVVISYGPLFLLAVAGGVLAWREAKMRLPVLWALATLVLIYAPVSFARKMIEGLHLPLCFLAAVGLIALLDKSKPRDTIRFTTVGIFLLTLYFYWDWLSRIWAAPLLLPLLCFSAIAGIVFLSVKKPSQDVLRLAASGVVLLLSLSSLQFVAWSLDNARDNNVARAGVLMPPLYLRQGDADAMQFLQAQPRGKVVLSLPYLGNYIPRESGQTVFAGHWAETLHFEQKLGQTMSFYSGKMNGEQARSWLRENRIGYVVIGSYETQLGARLPLELPVAYRQNGTTVYAVP